MHDAPAPAARVGMCYSDRAMYAFALGLMCSASSYPRRSCAAGWREDECVLLCMCVCVCVCVYIGWREDECMLQTFPAAVVARVLDPQPGQRV